MVWYRAYNQMMTEFSAKIRLFVDMPLAAQQRLTLPDAHRHYLVNVMRLAVGAPLTMFNGHDGEWAGHIAEISKKQCSVDIAIQINPQPPYQVSAWTCGYPSPFGRLLPW